MRISVRHFATTARRMAETVAEMETQAGYAMAISRAQGIAQDGFVSGTMIPPIGVAYSSER